MHGKIILVPIVLSLLVPLSAMAVDLGAVAAADPNVMYDNARGQASEGLVRPSLASDPSGASKLHLTQSSSKAGAFAAEVPAVKPVEEPEDELLPYTNRIGLYGTRAGALIGLIGGGVAGVLGGHALGIAVGWGLAIGGCAGLAAGAIVGAAVGLVLGFVCDLISFAVKRH